LYKSLSYDPVAEFSPISLVAISTSVLYAKNELAADTLEEFVELAKRAKGKLTFGSAGVGSIAHVSCLMLLADLHIDAQHVPYRGVAPALSDLISGQIDFMCDLPTVAAPQVRARQIKALAVLGSQRLTQLPEVRTVIETGLARTEFQ